MTKISLGVTIDQEIGRWIEKTRGTMPRSIFVNEILKAAMKKARITITTIRIEGADLT